MTSLARFVALRSHGLLPHACGFYTKPRLFPALPRPPGADQSAVSVDRNNTDCLRRRPLSLSAGRTGKKFFRCACFTCCPRGRRQLLARMGWRRPIYLRIKGLNADLAGGF